MDFATQFKGMFGPPAPPAVVKCPFDKEHCRCPHSRKVSRTKSAAQYQKEADERKAKTKAAADALRQLLDSLSPEERAKLEEKLAKMAKERCAQGNSAGTGTQSSAGGPGRKSNEPLGEPSRAGYFTACPYCGGRWSAAMANGNRRRDHAEKCGTNEGRAEEGYVHPAREVRTPSGELVKQ